MNLLTSGAYGQVVRIALAEIDSPGARHQPSIYEIQLIDSLTEAHAVTI